MKTQKQVRKAFWHAFPEFKTVYNSRKSQNDYKADIRCEFVVFVDSLSRDGQIPEALAERVTL